MVTNQIVLTPTGAAMFVVRNRRSSVDFRHHRSVKMKRSKQPLESFHAALMAQPLPLDAPASERASLSQ